MSEIRRKLVIVGKSTSLVVVIWGRFVSVRLGAKRKVVKGPVEVAGR